MRHYLILPLLLLIQPPILTATARRLSHHIVVRDGGIIRGDTTRRQIALVFTASAWADGAEPVMQALKAAKVKGNFFVTGEFVSRYPSVVRRLVKGHHYVGSHSWGHLLYAAWDRRDSTFVSRDSMIRGIDRSYTALGKLGVRRRKCHYFIPPYEHYNATVAAWAREVGLQIINYTPGTRSNADYTTPDMPNYASSECLVRNIMDYEGKYGLNGFLLMIHMGTHPDRKDKLYLCLPEIISRLQAKGYRFVTVDRLIEK